MELDHVDHVGVQPLEALVDAVEHVLPAAIPATLGSQCDALAPPILCQHLAEDRFAVPVAVTGRRVHVVDAHIERVMHRGDCRLAALRRKRVPAGGAVDAAEGIATQTNGRDLQVGATEGA